MVGDEVQPFGWEAAAKPGDDQGLRSSTTAEALLRITRMTDAESTDIGRFLAPSRLQMARRMLMAGLFWPGLLPDPAAINDN